MKRGIIAVTVRLNIIFFWLLISGIHLYAYDQHVDIVVAKDGTGDYKSLTGVFDSLSMYNYQRIVIYIKNGIYNEKIKIDRDYITIIGENRDSVIIQYSQLRSNWEKDPDHIGPAVVNIYADDVILKNLTIINTQPETGPHAFAVYGTGTRTILLNCSMISKGGDTVALWNYKEGMYYHSGCYFEGAVDLVCPRGWCFIENTQFYEVKKTASIWHAAVYDPDQKFVLKNCSFDGVEGFSLARHHYEAQFYFISCNFSGNMADKPIEHVIYPDEPNRNRPYFFGDRYYFYNCSRDGENYKWFGNNTEKWPANVRPETISVQWTFDNQWDPETGKNPEIIDYEIKGKELYLYFDELVGIRNNPVLIYANTDTLNYVEGGGRDILKFTSKTGLTEQDITHYNIEIIHGEIYSLIALVNNRKLANKINFK